MAKDNIQGNNRYTNAVSKEDRVDDFDKNRILLKILKDEFPDDRFFANNTLGHESPVKQALSSFKDPRKQRLSKTFPDAIRNTKNVLDLSTEKDEYAEYELAKSYPTIDEDALDDLIDEEWEYFEDPEEEDIVVVEEPKASGLFLVNSETDLNDFHDLYIDQGPQNIDVEDTEVAARVFCVFFIQNGVAKAIPTYKTLEVMLVERGLTYSAIEEATPDQIKDFDLLIDGEMDTEEVDYGQASTDREDDVSPLEEFRSRSMQVRDPDWNYSIRYRSGYLPLTPFVRDPGDYVKPESMRDVEGRKPTDEDGNALPSDMYVIEDPNDRYFDQVFQKQTYREKLREKYEGKMIIADWPVPEYDSSEVTQDTEIKSDDAVLNLRIMINGHWKFTRDGNVMKLYAYLNDYDISTYAPINAGRYGTTGYIQLLIDGGGVKVVQPAGAVDEDGPVVGNEAQTGDNDVTSKREPLWNAFPHIVDADDDGIKGVDSAEYKEYLDNFTNGGDPFGIEYLEPYEPKGSIKYYPRKQYEDLIAQALAQEAIDAIKEQIYEIWPGIASKIVSTKTQFDALPADYSSYVVNNLGPSGPLYKIMLSSKGSFKYIKKKTWFGKDKLKTKYSSSRIFKICAKRVGIKTSLNESQERQLVSKYKWMKTVARDKFAAWANGGSDASGAAGGVVAVGSGVALASSMTTAATVVSVAVADLSFLAAGTVLLPTVTVTAAPGIGALIGGMLTNPITLGVGILVGAFFLADAIIGEQEADKYDLPPWRFMDDDWYLKACILNEIDGDVEGFKMAADAADTNIPIVANTINEISDGMGEIDRALLDAMSVEEFQAIYDFLISIQTICDELNDSGLYQLGMELTNEIDAFVVKHLRRQYNAVQYLRKRIYTTGNLWKKRRKYGIVWAAGPQNILNTYVPGCKFNNYIPKL